MALAAARHGQPTPLVVRVVEEGTGRPAPNAEVLDLASGASRLTDERGELRGAWPSEGTLRLRVRQIGFRAVERQLPPGPGHGCPTR